MTIRPFQRFGRTIPINSYMNVDKQLYDELVLRQRVAIPLEQYKAIKNKEKAKKAQEIVDEIESTASRIAEEQKANSVQHVVVHHYDGMEEE